MMKVTTTVWHKITDVCEPWMCPNSSTYEAVLLHNDLFCSCGFTTTCMKLNSVTMNVNPRFKSSGDYNTLLQRSLKVTDYMMCPFSAILSDGKHIPEIRFLGWSLCSFWFIILYACFTGLFLHFPECLLKPPQRTNITLLEFGWDTWDCDNGHKRKKKNRVRLSNWSSVKLHHCNSSNCMF